MSNVQNSLISDQLELIDDQFDELIDDQYDPAIQLIFNQYELIDNQ